MSENIERKCKAKGVKLTDQRKIIAKIMSEAQDHPDVNELYIRVSKIDPKISIATVYRTVKLFEEAGIVTKHDFKGGKARYEEISEGHHDHLIDVNTGEIAWQVPFVTVEGGTTCSRNGGSEFSNWWADVDSVWTFLYWRRNGPTIPGLRNEEWTRALECGDRAAY